MLETQKYFQNIWYEVTIPADTEQCLENPELNMDDEHCFQTDIMRDTMEDLAKADRFLVLNHPKNWQDWYIWWAVLIELWLAYYLRKKIYILYPPQPKEIVRYSQEIYHMKPIILNWDLSKVD